MTVPPPAALGSNGPIANATKKSVGGLIHSAQTVVRFVRERSTYPPALRNVDYGCFDGQRKLDHTTERLQGGFKGSMPPIIGHMELLVWMQRADFSEHIQGCKSPGDPLNSLHFDAPNAKSAPTGYRRAPNIISHHYKQQLSAKASIVPKARPIRFR